MRSDNPRVKFVFPKAMYEHDPSVDLFNQFDTHQCDICLSSLQKFTKIIAQRIQRGPKPSNKGFKVYCVPCFAGWSKFPIDPIRIQEATYRYYVCRKIDQKISEFGEWSPFQVLHLHKCLQNFGPEIYPESGRYFLQRTEIPRSLIQLSKKVKELNRNVFEPNNVGMTSGWHFEKGWHSDENSIKSHLSNLKNIIQGLKTSHDMKLEDKEEEKQALHFLKLINHRHPVEKARKYPDVPENYFSRAFVNNSFSPENSLEIEVQESGYDKFARVFQKISKEKVEREKEILEFTERICFEYATLRRRRNRKSSMPQQAKARMKLEDLSHPELQLLLQIEGAQEEVSRVIQIAKDRSQFFRDLKERKKLIDSKGSSAREEGEEEQEGSQSDSSKNKEGDNQEMKVSNALDQ